MKRVRIENFPELDYATNEALNTLCTNLVFMGDSVSRILVTSCRADEGKSFISMNIMRTMARMGRTVALVDAERRAGVLMASSQPVMSLLLHIGLSLVIGLGAVFVQGGVSAGADRRDAEAQ